MIHPANNSTAIAHRSTVSDCVAHHCADPNASLRSVQAPAGAGVVCGLGTLVGGRPRPVFTRRKARVADLRISALIGTFLLAGVVLFPCRELSAAAGLASTLLMFAGTDLRFSRWFGCATRSALIRKARDRHLRRYRFVRHPLYLAEKIATFGSVIQFLSVWTTLLAIVQTLFQLRRLSNEEAPAD
jgi:protein-S-isoprenylcysteine O-methyltransferase Ste14